MSPSTEIAVHSSTDLAALESFREILLGNEEPAEIVEDPEEISRRIMAELMDAESDDALQNFGKAQAWRELEGVPISLLGFRWRVSEFDEGGPVYVIVRGFRTDTGESVVLTTGSGNVLAQLYNLAKRQTLAGSTWSLVKGEKTRAGFNPLHLEKVPGGDPSAEAEKA